jgi:hypothetical protein
MVHNRARPTSARLKGVQSDSLGCTLHSCWVATKDKRQMAKTSERLSTKHRRTNTKSGSLS